MACERVCLWDGRGGVLMIKNAKYKIFVSLIFLNLEKFTKVYSII